MTKLSFVGAVKKHLKPRISAPQNFTISVGLITFLGWTGVAMAQQLSAVQQAETPLVLKSRGSFFVGGENVKQTKVELGSVGPEDNITVNQMYVEFMVPNEGDKVPTVMIHGSTLSGKTYDTTPDGRMGWFEYFVRNGHPTYVVDQVGRARSGFNQASFNNAREGLAPIDEQIRPRRLGDNYGVWQNFRFGREPGVPYPHTQFPTGSVAELSKQSVPDLNAPVPASYRYTINSVAALAKDLGGAVLMGHSQGGPFPAEAALLEPSYVKGIVAVEPGSCAKYDDSQIQKLAKIPMLILYGDELDTPINLPTRIWKERAAECKTLVDRLKAIGGNASIIFLNNDLGIKGNSHMMMMDENSLDIADQILKWMDQEVKK